MTLNIEILDAKIQSKDFDFSFNYKGNIDGCIRIFGLFNVPYEEVIKTQKIQKGQFLKTTGQIDDAYKQGFEVKREPYQIHPVARKPIKHNSDIKIHINPETLEVTQKYTANEVAKLFEMASSTFYVKQAQGITPKPDITEGKRKYFSKAIVEKYILKMNEAPKQKVEIDDNYEAHFEDNADAENDLVNGLKKILGK